MRIQVLASHPAIPTAGHGRQSSALRGFGGFQGKRDPRAVGAMKDAIRT